MKKRPYQFPYCLHCYAPLELKLATDSQKLGARAGARSNARASVTCSHCDSINLVVDAQRHWTKEPVIVEIEWWLKAAVVVLIGAMTVAILMSRQQGLSAAGHGMVVGAPILSAVVLWDLTSITLKRGLFNGSIIWGVMAGAVALNLALLMLLPSIQADAPSLLLIGLLLVVGVVFPWRIKRRWEAWREARVARMQAEVAAS